MRNESDRDQAKSFSPIGPSNAIQGMVTPQDNPELFTSGLWPTLQRPQTSIFDGRRSPRRELDDVDSERRSAGPDAVEWYERQVLRHKHFQQCILVAERRGLLQGAIFGIIFIIAFKTVSEWSPPLPARFLSWIGAVEPEASETVVWTAKELELLQGAQKTGGTRGVVLQSAVAFLILLSITLGVGISGAVRGSGAVALVFLTVIAFLMIIVTSCYSGHVSKRAQYKRILQEEVPQNVPSLLQLEIAQRNARVMHRLLQAERRSSHDHVYATTLVREERNLEREVASLSTRKLAPLSHRGGTATVLDDRNTLSSPASCDEPLPVDAVTFTDLHETSFRAFEGNTMVVNADDTQPGGLHSEVTAVFEEDEGPTVKAKPMAHQIGTREV